MRYKAGKERRGRYAAFPLRCLCFIPRDKLNKIFGRIVFLFGYQSTSQSFGKMFNTENTLTICPLVGSTYQGWLFFKGSEWAAEYKTPLHSFITEHPKLCRVCWARRGGGREGEWDGAWKERRGEYKARGGADHNRREKKEMTKRQPWVHLTCHLQSCPVLSEV